MANSNTTQPQPDPARETLLAQIAGAIPCGERGDMIDANRDLIAKCLMRVVTPTLDTLRAENARLREERQQAYAEIDRILRGDHSGWDAALSKLRAALAASTGAQNNGT